MTDLEAQIVASVYRDVAGEMRMGEMWHTATAMEEHAASIEAQYGRLPKDRPVTDDERKEVRDEILEQMGLAAANAVKRGTHGMTSN